jgi:hypothetical protein
MKTWFWIWSIFYSLLEREAKRAFDVPVPSEGRECQIHTDII